MKDYTINKEDKKMFILSYKIKDKNIIAKLATGEKYIIPYTKENEEKILERMIEQITKYPSFEKKAAIDYCITTILAFIIGVATILIGRNDLPQLFANPTIKTIIASIPTFVAGTITTIAVGLSVTAKNILKDFRKNKLYLDNEEDLNNKVKESQNILSNVTNKTKRMVNTTPENKPVFNINKIDKVSLEDLKQILENIKRDEEFAFDYEPKKLKRTRDE